MSQVLQELDYSHVGRGCKISHTPLRAVRNDGDESGRMKAPFSVMYEENILSPSYRAVDVAGVGVTLKTDVKDSRDISQKRDSARLFNGRIADLIVNVQSHLSERFLRSSKL